MHLGNLSVEFDGDSFSLLPVYDMCSMGFSPKGSEVLPISFNIDEAIDKAQHVAKDFSRVARMAKEFWDRVAKDDRTSEELRKYIVESLDYRKKLDF